MATAGPWSAASGQQSPVSPVYPIIVEAPTDLSSLWTRLVDPDFVLLDGKSYQELAKKSKRTVGNPTDGVIDAIELTGEVIDDRATMTMTVHATLVDAEPRWIPVRLDGLALGRAREGDRELATQFTPGTGWEIELRGAGKHRALLTFTTPARALNDGRRLEWAIPEVPSSSLRVDVEGRVSSASVGDGEPATIELIEGGQRRRLTARVSPRSRLVIDWKIDDRADTKGEPLLTAQGQILLSITASSITARSTWEIQALRGEVSVIQLQLDPMEEVIGLDVDGAKRDVQADPAGIVTIELTKPLNLTRSLKLSCTTRKRLSTLPATIGFHGHPLLKTKTQTGLLAVRPGDDLWISASLGPLIRQIDPRSELPDELRNQPGRLLGFVFIDQPFELKLQVESPAAMALVSQATAIQVDRREARLFSWIDLTITQGRLFEAVVNVGPNLDLVKVGPAELIRSSRLVPVEGGGSKLLLQFANLSREYGPARLTLEGRAPLPVHGSTELGLFEMVQPQAREHRLAITASPDRQVDLAPSPVTQRDPNTTFDPAEWPAGPGELAAPPILVRAIKSTDRIALVVAPHRQLLRSTSKLDTTIRPDSIDVIQRVEVSTDFGEIERVELVADPRITAHWSLEGGEDLTETSAPDATTKTYSAEVLGGEDGTALLTFAYRIPIQPTLLAGRATELMIPRVQVRHSVEAPAEFQVTTLNGLLIEPISEPWRSRDETSRPRLADRISVIAPLPETMDLPLKVSAPIPADLPLAVASRLWLQTEVTKELWHTTARYKLASKRPSLTFRLPAAAKNLAVNLAGQIVTKLARVNSNPPSYRLELPAELVGRGSFLVEIDYSLDTTDAGMPWTAPELLETTTQQTVWEIDLPRSSVPLGIPSGWTDESPIDWGMFQSLLGRTTREDRLIRTWFGSNAPAAEFSTGRNVQRLLFSRIDAPVPLRLRILSRTLLVAVASSMALALSLATLIGRFRPWVMSLLLTSFALVMTLSLETRLIVVLAESSLLGVILGLVAFGLQRVIDRRRQVTSYPDCSGSLTVAPPPNSTAEYTPVGSDDSTAIRIRPGSSRGRLVIDSGDQESTTPLTGESP